MIVQACLRWSFLTTITHTIPCLRFFLTFCLVSSNRAWLSLLENFAYLCAAHFKVHNAQCCSEAGIFIRLFHWSTWNADYLCCITLFLWYFSTFSKGSFSKDFYTALCLKIEEVFFQLNPFFHHKMIWVSSTINCFWKLGPMPPSGRRT